MLPESSAVDFDRHIREWVCSACRDWAAAGQRAWLEPGPKYYGAIARRLPPGLRQILAAGLAEEPIISLGWRFKLKDLAESKGPYRRLRERQWPGGPEGPHPNWEYFVHVAEFVRLHRAAMAHGLRLDFEDHSMDLTLYEGRTLLVCVEVSEQQISDQSTDGEADKPVVESSIARCPRRGQLALVLTI